MSAPWSVVLPATLVVSSPSLWMLYQGSLSADETLRRVLVCLGLAWVGLSVVAAVAFPRAGRTPDPAVAEDASTAPEGLDGPGAGTAR